MSIQLTKFTAKRADFERQMANAQLTMFVELELIQREAECWRMFGIRAEWFMDELVITAP